MNSLKVSELINTYIKELNCSQSFEITDLYDQIQDQVERSIVFLKVTEKYDASFFKKQEKQNVLYITTAKCGFHSEIIIEVKNFLEVQKIIIDFIYPINTSAKIIGITGTNGKTSTAYYLNQMLSLKSLKTFYIGTIGIYHGNNFIDRSLLTSPSFLKIRKIINKDYDAFIFEVSSHALIQKRFYHLRFDFGAWTSFSQDHLDYHKTMEEYFKAKLLILEHIKPEGCCLIYEKENELVQKLKDYEKIEIIHKIQDFENYFYEVNKTLAYSLAKRVSNDDDIDLSKITEPPGRYERFNYKNNEIIIDFAHTPAALEKLLSEVSKNYPNKTIVCVFGCGGDRDQSKRSIMGKAVSKYAHLAIITEDNNRSESFYDIAEDIAVGVSVSYKKIEFRPDAIKEACLNSKNSVIVITGKGHEDTIERGGKKHPFNDRTYIKELIDEY